VTNRITQFFPPEPDPEKTPEPEVDKDASDLGGIHLPQKPDSSAPPPQSAPVEPEEQPEGISLEDAGVEQLLELFGALSRAERESVDQSTAPPLNWPLIRLYVRDALPPELRHVVFELESRYDVWEQATTKADIELRAEGN
jgi:hypothetical protein